MTDIAVGRQLRLPEDLAKMLITDGIAVSGGIEQRSSVIGIIEATATFTTAIITLVQIPVTLEHARELLTRWVDTRRTNGTPLAHARAHLPSGAETLITPDTQDTEIVTIICTMIYRPPARPPADE
jgi:hypothetical protein